MSTEEQQALIGRMVMERADAIRKRALLQQKISEYRAELEVLLRFLYPTNINTEGSIKVVATLIKMGGLDQLNEVLTESHSLHERVTQLALTLKEAGVD
jgi:hypothetical protein